MRRCCEAVLRVLRAHKEALVTIVEVLIHDPLYRWALTPASLARRQGEGAAEPSSVEDGGGGLANADAERAVLRVKQKLLGLESGTLPYSQTVVSAFP
jgi:serine-protein kinase ATM